MTAAGSVPDGPRSMIFKGKLYGCLDRIGWADASQSQRKAADRQQAKQAQQREGRPLRLMALAVDQGAACGEGSCLDSRDS